MGHYCRICGRTRANEKFLGKGHKNHMCKDCSGKFGTKIKKNTIDENFFTSETAVLLSDILIQRGSTHLDDNWFSEIDFERNVDDENDEDLLF